MTTAPNISIIIVSYNVREYIKKCIDSVLFQKDITYEIIVIDNNSLDGTVELIKAKYPFVKLICNSKNSGFSAANNQGIKVSTGEFILLLNPDTELKETDILRNIRDYLVSAGQDIILAPCLLNTDGSFQPSFWKFPVIKDLILELFYFHRLNRTMQPNSPIPVSAASGAALAFSKKLAEKIGYLDESLFWMEDIDFCFRAAKAGLKTVFCPEIKIIHHGGKSSVNNYSIVIPNQVMSKIKFYKKNGTRIQFILVNIISIIFICSRYIAFTLLSISMKRIWQQKRDAYFAAFKAFISYNF